MAPKKIFKAKSFWLTVSVNVVLLIAVLFLMNYVQYALNADVRINLSEIVTQNKDVINSKLMAEVNSLEVIATQFSTSLAKAKGERDVAMREIFSEYARDKSDEKLYWASAQGLAWYPDGQEIEISGREYFILAMQGRPNISARIVSRKNGDDIFVISVPLTFRDEIIGTVQRHYTPEEMYNLCSVSLFSEQGYMYIINSEGYIVISSQPDKYGHESDNYYRMVYLNDPAAANQLQKDIENGRAGFMETESNGEKLFSAYTPIENLHDWYLITSISTAAVSPNANMVIRLFYCVLFVWVIIFALSMMYSLSLKKKQQADLERIAFVDTVTQGNTYTKFAMDCRNQLAEQPETQFYLFTFDIDNFKYINSFYGFDVGDSILREIYALYRSRLAPGETIARVTGDHFVMLLQDAAPERLEILFESELQLGDITVYLSAGLYPVSAGSESLDLMMDKANLAAQKIKGKRYKRVAIYSEEFDREMTRNEQIKRAIEQALEQDEIVPFFQPKVDVDTRKLVGAEALARWRKPDGTLVPPGHFIPVCEQTGLVSQVDMAIFEKTLQFIRKHLDANIACVPISVNFSRLHLLNMEFLESLLEKLERYNVPPQLIELELTETVMFDNAGIISDFIENLHKNGLTISMDDFGSGYSSLHMLKDVDIDVLKIDRGFLMESQNSNRQKVVFEAIARMAEKLNIHVVVEGVETQENVKLMTEFGCKTAQGFLFAKPMAEQDFSVVYTEGHI